MYDAPVIKMDFRRNTRRAHLLLLLLISFFVFLIAGIAEAETYQPALWFMDDLLITQVPGGDYSHAGTLNFDVVGRNNFDIKAPFDCEIVDLFPTYECGNTVVIQSVNMVQYANGSVGYMSLAFGHDNDISDCYIGRRVAQGEVFCQNGDYGNANGVHSHVTVIAGKYTDAPGFIPVSTGNYTFSNAIRPEKALFITDSTNIINTQGISFIKYPGYVNLGDDFYGVILNTKYWKPISQKADTNRIYLETEDGSSRQIWRFIRQEDDSYVISSCYDGKVLEMSEGKREICTQITAAAEDWGGAYQRWYLIRYGNGYIIKSKHYPDEDWVMDNYGDFEQDDNIIQINNRNNSTAQVWSVYAAYDVQLTGPALTVMPGSSASPTQFEWVRSYGATSYNLRIFKDVIWEGEDYSVMNASNGAQVILPAGNYVAYVDAVNYHKYIAGEVVSFTVPEESVIQDLFDMRDEALTLNLPADLTMIGAEAFADVSAVYFVLPEGIKMIESKAFPNNSMVFLYGQSIESISDIPFNGSGIIVEMGNVYSLDLANKFKGTEVQYVKRDGTRITE